MLTLYSPISGVVTDLPQGAGLAVTASEGPQVVAAPTRGTVTKADAVGVTLTDLRDRVVELHVQAPDGSLEPVAAVGDALGFDAPIFTWTGAGELLVSVTSPGSADLLAHVEPGQRVAAGADLFSVGPFSCGA